MSPTTKPMFSLVIPARYGAVDLRGCFPRIPVAQVRIDKELREFAKTAPSTQYSLEQPLPCEMEKASDGGVLSSLLGLTDKTKLNVDQVCAIMVYFGTDGWRFLELPSQKKEISILMGYVPVGGKHYAVMIEHEYNNGKEEIDLHVRKPGHQEYGPVLVLKIT